MKQFQKCGVRNSLDELASVGLTATHICVACSLNSSSSCKNVRRYIPWLCLWTNVIHIPLKILLNPACIPLGRLTVRTTARTEFWLGNIIESFTPCRMYLHRLYNCNFCDTREIKIAYTSFCNIFICYMHLRKWTYFLNLNR